MVDKIKQHPKVIGLFCIATLVLVAGLAVAYWPTSPPPMPDSMDDVKTLLASNKYERLSKAQKEPYQERAREIMSTANGEQKRDLMKDESTRDATREMFKQMILAKAKEFALADDNRKQQMIQEAQPMMKAMGGGRRGPGGGKPGGDKAGGDKADRPEPTEEQLKEREERMRKGQEWMEDMVNTGNGQEMALMHEYMRAVRGDKKR